MTPQTPQTLKEQLAPLRHAVRSPRSSIKPVCQVMLRLKPIHGQDRFETTVRSILSWMKNRAGKELPEKAWALESFELEDVGAQHTAAVSIRNPRYWAARLDDADKDVPQRSWITEVGVHLDSNDDVVFGTRLTCVARADNPYFIPTIPGFVRGILAAGPCELDGMLVTNSPTLVATSSDVDKLLDLLENPDRTADVVVVSQLDSSDGSAESLIDARAVAQRLHGIAHLYLATPGACYELTARVGKQLSVFRQAIRTYRPGFRAWLDDPVRHPLALSSRLIAGGPQGRRKFEDSLCATTTANTARIAGREERLPPFSEIRALAARLERQLARQRGATDAELAQLYQEENERLAQEKADLIAEYAALLSNAEEERDREINRAREAIAQAMVARARVLQLEERIRAQGNDQSYEIPDGLEDLEAWCEEHLAGSPVIMNPRAYQGAKKSQYDDPSHVYRVLILLKDYYVPMRLQGGDQIREKYLQKLRSLETEESGVGEGARFEGDEYTVLHHGRRRLLERHFKRGTSRDPRYCFRLYFFWDDDTQTVVVGWLPSHLDNRLT